MPIHVNKIVYGADPEDPEDYFAFEDIQGRLQPKAEQLEVFVRPGHVGETLRKTGVRALPSQILTIHYVADWAAAKAAIESYIGLIDGDPYQIIQHTTSYGYFRVLQVVEVDARACVNAIGTLIANPTVVQVCQWTVISTEAPEP